MNKFNLTFWGEILPGKDPEQVKSRFGRLFQITDPDRLAHFFSGETIILRRNLDRKVAGEYYQKLRKLGVESELVRVTDAESRVYPARRDAGSGSGGDRELARQEAEALQRAETAAQHQRQAQLRAEAEAREEKRRKREAERQRKLEQQGELKKQREAQAQARRQQREAERAERARQAQLRRDEELDAQRRARELEEHAIERGARALADTGAIKTGRGTVKSRLELPRRDAASRALPGGKSTEAPNLYRLRPFRVAPGIRERPAIARQKMRQAMFTAGITLGLLLILLGRFLSLAPAEPLTGPGALAVSPAGELLLLAGDEILLHDRAGVSTRSVAGRELGLETLAAPIAYTPAGHLLLTARQAGEVTGAPRLWQCDLAAAQCSALALANAPAAVSVHPLTGALFVADSSGPSLAKLGPNGEPGVSSAYALAENPVLRLDSGLLLINSSEGPAVSVLRYEDQAFGQQLDEILLLPAAAMEARHNRVWDFVTSGSHWWVVLYNPDSGDSGLYLFASDWTFLRQLPSDPSSPPGRLVNWGEKVLFYHPQASAIRRFSAAGSPEAPLESASLKTVIASKTQALRWRHLAWLLTLMLVSGALLVSLARGHLHRVRALVYRSRPASGAAPLDAIADEISWIPALAARAQRLRNASVGLGVLSLAVILLLIGLGASFSTLLGTMLALCGPIISMQLLLRSDREYVGVWHAHLVLVDHRQCYHMASEARVQYRGPFLLIDDVLVFTGTPLLPALDPAAVARKLAPLIEAGARVDRKTVLVKLLESQHPIARGAQVLCLCSLAGLLVMILGQLPWRG